MDELDREWRDLIATRRFASELDAFVRRHRVLAALGDSPKAPRWDPEVADGVLHALLADCAEGSYPAGRTVLQCMIPAMRSIVRRSPRHYPDVGELQAETTAAMWAAIVSYDLGKTTRVAMRLQGVTLTAVVGDGAPHARGRRVSRSKAPVEVAVPDVALEHLVDRQAGRDAPAEGSVLGATGEVLELLAWGVESRVISPAEGELLTRLHAPDPRRPEYAELGGERGAYVARVAEELGTTPAAVRQRASRAIRRLVRVVHEGNYGH